MTRARQLGFRITELPVTHRPRASGESKVSLREIPRTAMRLLRFWWTNVVLGPKPLPITEAVFQGRVSVPAGVAERIPVPAAYSSEDHRVELPARHREAA